MKSDREGGSRKSGRKRGEREREWGEGGKRKLLRRQRKGKENEESEVDSTVETKFLGPVR